MQEQSESDLNAQRRREKHRKYQREYQRKYRRKYPEKEREHKRKWNRSLKGRESNSKRDKRRYKEDLVWRKKQLDRAKRWAQANPEKNRARARRHYQQNRLAILQTEREKRLTLKTEVFRLLGDKCVRCGFTDVHALQVDHVHGGGGKELRKITHSHCHYALVLESIERGEQKYQLLCANCNWIKAYENHEREGS